MKNAAFPDQIGGCEKSMHYPDEPKKERKKESGFKLKPDSGKLLSEDDSR